ncbi:MAG TPA: hypothetical protein VGR52_10625 [Stellaceae bacterium]|nr:hypothetical protein [Stellaceae bacterium]
MAVSAEKIVWDYALFLERRWGTGDGATLFYDESVLPYLKQKILESLEAVISREPRDDRVEIQKAVAVCLADYQSGVGPEPFDDFGLTPSQTERMLKLMQGSDEEIKAGAELMANAPYRDRAERLKKIRDEEAKLIAARIEVASRLREKRRRGLFGFLR